MLNSELPFHFPISLDQRTSPQGINKTVDITMAHRKKTLSLDVQVEMKQNNFYMSIMLLNMYHML